MFIAFQVIELPFLAVRHIDAVEPDQLIPPGRAPLMAPHAMAARIFILMMIQAFAPICRRLALHDRNQAFTLHNLAIKGMVLANPRVPAITPVVEYRGEWNGFDGDSIHLKLTRPRFWGSTGIL